MKDGTAKVTLEMCMTGLDRGKAAVFYKNRTEGGKTENYYSAREMTKDSGISDIIPSHVICDFDFDPCGYSMNGIGDDGAYSTVHVTPEEGFSYASYEAMGLDPERTPLEPLVKRVLRCFEPSEFSLAITCFGSGVRAPQWTKDEDGNVEGYERTRVVKQEVGGGCVVYKTYTAVERGGKGVERTCKEVMQCRKEVMAEEGGGEAVECGVLCCALLQFVPTV
ncbi:hypothetical protein Ancab_027688 [Ancistrocladus abbreviatus]